MASAQHSSGPTARNGGLWLAVAGLGVLANPMMLVGSVFMLQVYDRVLPAQSEPTLAVLFALVAFIYAMLALIDAARARLMVRIAARLVTGIEKPVIKAWANAQSRDPPDPRAAIALSDLDAVQRALSSPAMLAFMDAPWSFGFLALLFLFHPAMGALALSGGAVLVAIALFGQWRQRGERIQAMRDSESAQTIVRALQDDAECAVALGMVPSMSSVWQGHRARALSGLIGAADRAAFDSAMAKSFRLFMQSAMLALGAVLVMRGYLSPGLIVAASILMGRALAPVEVLAGQWSTLGAARNAWGRLKAFLAAQPDDPRQRWADADGALTVQAFATSPGNGGPVLRINGFAVPAGHALGVIGPSGSGKTTLARALIGALPMAPGVVRLGDCPIAASAIRLGYLPQRPTLFEGTIAQNIARFEIDADRDSVVAAARLAGAHAAIARLPRDYETILDRRGRPMSAGQVQAIALARALYCGPPLVVLDEPNAQLDSVGSVALNAAIRELKARGAVVVVMAHRPAAIAECDDLLVLESGTQVAFGPRDPVLREFVRNHTALVQPSSGTVG